MRRARLFLLSAAAALGVPAAPGAAQDIEALAALRGVPLPAAYYERVRRDPGAFTAPPVWRNLAAAGPAFSHGAGRDTVRILLMPGLFADSPEPPVSAAQMQQTLFGANPLGSLTDFYRELSGGRVHLTGTVLPWVRTPFTRAAVAGTAFGMGPDGNVGGFLRQILRRVDPGIDFGRYDDDGPDRVPNSGDDDGYVDMPVFQFEGPAGSCGAMGVWPHYSTLDDNLGGPYTTDDPRPGGGVVMVNGYHIQSAVECNGAPQNISVIAHETGHAFGLPDFYDFAEGLLPAQRRWVLGCFSLMAAGAWGCGDAGAFSTTERPTHMAPWEKLRLGWASVQVAQPGWRRAYTLRPVQQTGDVLRVPLRDANEYLLVEYRPNTGFDAALPAGGVLVYQVDSLRPLGINCDGCDRIYHVTLIEADGDGALLRTVREGGDRGVAGDVFRGRRVLDALSQPRLRLNSGRAANVALEIEVAADQARIVVSILPVVNPVRLLAPVLGSPGGPPAPDDQLALDLFGNRNGRYDLGDLRAYLRSRPGAVVPPS